MATRRTRSRDVTNSLELSDPFVMNTLHIPVGSNEVFFLDVYMGVSMAVSRVAVVVCVGVLGIMTTSSWAANPDPFTDLPPSCADQAREEFTLLDWDAQVASKTFADKDDPDAVAYESLFTKLNNMTSLGETLLQRAFLPTLGERLSPQITAEAEKIYRDYLKEPATADNSGFYDGHYYQELGGVQYSCVTRSCSTAQSCETINTRAVAAKVRTSLPVHRKYFTKVVRWAQKAKISGVNFAKLRREYTKQESELKRLVRTVPPSLASIKVFPRNG